jgi:hypothetical protein
LEVLSFSQFGRLISRANTGMLPLSDIDQHLVNHGFHSPTLAALTPHPGRLLRYYYRDSA